MTLQIYNITEAMSSVSPIIFNYNPANSKTLSMAAFSPSAFLPPAVAKWGWPPPPPWISLAASFTRLPAFSPPATRLSLSMTVSIGLPSASVPATKNRFSVIWPRNWKRCLHCFCRQGSTELDDFNAIDFLHVLLAVFLSAVLLSLS